MIKIERDLLLRELSYDSVTGLFTGLRQRSPSALAGRQAGSPTKKGYIAITVRGKKFLAHRLAWFFVFREWPEHQIDHVNGVKSDNRIVNLREASASDNQCNRPAQRNNQAGVKGLYFETRRGKWRVRVSRERKEHHVGYFATKEEAYEAWKQAAGNLHGEFFHVG